MIGSWPLELPDDAAVADYRARIEAYMIKALREAKEHSSWVRVNADHEAAMSGFVQGLLAAGEKNLFLAGFVPLVQPIIRHGLLNALAQTLVKLASPGVPDTRIAEVVGKAGSEPLYPDNPFASANRRISIVLLKEAPVIPPDL